MALVVRHALEQAPDRRYPRPVEVTEARKMVRKEGISRLDSEKKQGMCSIIMDLIEQY